MRCHYSKLPCHVDGVPALNPISHYRPKSYSTFWSLYNRCPLDLLLFLETLNAFGGALDTLQQHADAIEDILIAHLSGINVLAHLTGLRVQASLLRQCAEIDGELEAQDGDDEAEGEEDEVPEDVAEGVAGPSKKRKHK